MRTLRRQAAVNSVPPCKDVLKVGQSAHSPAVRQRSFRLGFGSCGQSPARFATTTAMTHTTSKQARAAFFDTNCYRGSGSVAPREQAHKKSFKPIELRREYRGRSVCSPNGDRRVESAFRRRSSALPSPLARVSRRDNSESRIVTQDKLVRVMIYGSYSFSGQRR